MTLMIMITTVQAKSSFVMTYSFASYSILPIEPAGIPITSAAIPDFQPKPIPTDTAARKKGATDGI
jgi:hypothetical protein